MPWRVTGYEHIYFFRKRRMILYALPVAAILLLLWFVTNHYLGDPNYKPSWHPPRCHGKRCGGAILMYVLIFGFLSLPVWVKLPLTAGGAGEALTWLLARLKWSFDRSPDFAIGPHGLYGLCGLQYFDVSWAEVTRIKSQTTITLFGANESLTIFTTKLRPSWNWLGKPKRKAVQIGLIPLHGLPLRTILGHVKRYAPDLQIETTQINTLPRWLQ